MNGGPNRRWIVLWVALLAFGGVGRLHADLDAVVTASSETVLLAQSSQQTIDRVVEETNVLGTEYSQITKQLDGLEIYNAYMGRQIANQESEIVDLERSIEQISSIERQIMPLMIRMLDGLERFIELDLPFLAAERMGRVASLRDLMERADVSVAEKFRRLTEAFLIENDFGRTIETYKETLEIAGATREVNIFRLGRVGLYYQTNDAGETGFWDAAAATWTPLGGGTARNHVRDGIRIARRQIAPDLLLLDVPAPENAR